MELTGVMYFLLTTFAALASNENIEPNHPDNEYKIYSPKCCPSLQHINPQKTSDDLEFNDNIKYSGPQEFIGFRDYNYGSQKYGDAVENSGYQEHRLKEYSDSLTNSALKENSGSLQYNGLKEISDSLQYNGPNEYSDYFKYSGQKPQDCFDVQVDKLVGRVQTARDELRALSVVRGTVENTLKTIWPDCKVKLFGSLSTGLGAAGSDVDLTVFLPQPYDRDVISLAVTAFQASPDMYQNIHTRSRLPAITFNFKPFNLKCDIDFKNEGRFESKLLHYLLNLDHRAFKLAFMIKHWGKLHKVIRPKYLTSYGMMAMVVFYLQQISILPSVLELQNDYPPLILNSTNNFNVAFERKHLLSRNNESLYEILGGFFEFYEHFDFDQWIVCPFTGQPVKKILFSNLNTVPDEFNQYKTNVANNLTLPLNITAVCVQSLLMLNDNCAWRIDNLKEFVANFRIGAQLFRYHDKCRFLKAIGIVEVPSYL